MVGEALKIRKLNKNDMSDVIELLQSMSEFRPPESEYSQIWNEFDSQNNVHSIVALTNKKVIGYGSIIIETKIRGGKMGHIEDIVSHIDFRKKGIGKSIIDELFEIAKKEGCYKVALQCKEHNVSFYEKNSYVLNGISMQRFK